MHGPRRRHRAARSWARRTKTAKRKSGLKPEDVEASPGFVYFRDMRTLVLILLLSLSTSCTAAQWQAFQASNAELANYVSDAMLAVHIVENFIGGRSVETQDVFEAIDAANEALQAEADVVRNVHAPLDTPVQIAAAFPRFITAWNHLSEAVHGHRMASSSSASPTAFTSPALVRVTAALRHE